MITVRQVSLLLLAFIAGWGAHIAISSDSPEAPSDEAATGLIDSLFSSGVIERQSPYDWVNESQIKVGKDMVMIDIKNAEWARFTDTNSMDPVIDAGANAIQIVPTSEDMVHVGDVISFTTPYAEGTIIHRVVQIDYDDLGWYAITKGDNIASPDPGKVRFDDIRRILVAVIY